MNMNRSVRRIPCLVAVMVWIGGLGARPAMAARPTLDEVRAKVAQILDEEHVPGAGLALVDAHGVVWAGGVGVADRATRAPVTAQTRFRAASVTKSFIALAVMQLV